MKEKLLVWIIDDDAISKYVMKRNLKELKIENIVDFPDSVEPLEILNANFNNPNILPDVIFLDMHMPVIDGFQFLKDYKTINLKIEKNILIYMLSSSNNPEDMIRAKSYPELFDYFVKPLELNNLEQIIETVALQ